MSETGCLYVVSTPIGNLDDMTERGIQTLRQVDLIAAEDTRHSGRLLKHLNIDTPMLSLHQHNEDQRTQYIAELLLKGQNIALISDAGTPLISDPGYKLVATLRQQHLAVSPIPGSCALVAAISVAGLATDRFTFEGFLSAKSSARKQQLSALKDETRTMVFYVSIHQATKQLNDCRDVFGADRDACLARELTKLHETIWTGSLQNLTAKWSNHPEQHKGELVLVIQGATKAATSDQELIRVLKILLAECSPRQSASLAASLLGCRRNAAYQQALHLSQSSNKS